MHPQQAHASIHGLLRCRCMVLQACCSCDIHSKFSMAWAGHAGCVKCTICTDLYCVTMALSFLVVSCYPLLASGALYTQKAEPGVLPPSRCQQQCLTVGCNTVFSTVNGQVIVSDTMVHPRQRLTFLPAVLSRA